VILVDTNVWSELNKPKPNKTVMAWIEENEPDLWLSPLVVAEIRYGLERPEAVAKKAGLTEWLSGLEDEYRDRTLLFDSAAGHSLGMLLLSKPQNAKLLDTLIAAQALSRDWPVATRNGDDFEWTGVKLINPWET
jgi:toxin FitB